MPSSTGLTARPLRPTFAVRPGFFDDCVVLAGEYDRGRTRRFLRRTGDGQTRPLVVPAEVDRVAGWSIVDFTPTADGGIFLLEILHHDADRTQEWVNRVRHIDRSGATLWSRSGPFDLHYTDPANLIGHYTGLQHPTTGGPLWIIPHATTAGIPALDPTTGDLHTMPRLDTNVRNLVITPTGHALYARMTEDSGRRTQRLADTDLATGQTTFTAPDPPVPLINLAGLDYAGHLYARTGDGIARITPHWRVRLHGAVHDPQTATTTIAHSTVAHPQELLITEHQPRQRPDGPHPSTTWQLPTGHLPARSITLIDIEPGPRFVLHLNGSLHTPGSITTLTPDGTIVSATGPDHDTARQLTDRENRLDLTQTVITTTGTILAPLANPHGYHLIHLQPLHE
ncbi:hypothetical protein [Micromonospora sp. CB01531]|uniref:hypothetical protein n=1 Tax=Micromonospora sp. CB01531 TaxID=1718947 RepID=UPI00093F02B1|nr:hypothetical protein [Micromonospora sp. CB01531]OKI84540.1 hypothetical protein A6A27_40445 [Micromonospora sp. CB01531]